METAGQMKGYRQTASQNMHGSAQHAPQKSVAASPAQHVAKPESEWTEKEAKHFITQRVQGETASELKPFQAKAAQIAGSEAASANRYRGFTGEAEKANAGILANQQAGAKTTDNIAAENVLKAAEPTATAGNNIATQNAGYVSPQVQAALTAGAASTAGIASAAQAKALTQGQGEENYLRDLNAQATQRYVAGQGQLSESFGKEKQANANEEARVTSRGAGAINKSIESFNTRRSNTALAEDKLRSEGVKLATTTAQKENASKRTSATSEGNRTRSAAVSRANAQESNATKASQQAFKEYEAKEQIGISRLSAQDKARYDNARIAIQSGKTKNEASGKKYLQTLNNAYSVVHNELEEGRKRGVSGEKLYNIVRKQLTEGKHTGKGKEVGSPMGANLIKAALNLNVYGRFDAADAAEAQALGLTPSMKPYWFRTK
jgi:hypothetical protein